MSQSFIKLNPKQCDALLHAIVDCDHDLYNQIKSCADEYTNNPELYEIETNIINWVYRSLCPQIQITGIDIEHMEYNRYKVFWFNSHYQENDSCIVEYIDENHINKL